MPDGKTVVKHTRFGDIGGYTPVKVKNKDTQEIFVINFKNAKITGNEAEWTIKDGKVYDKNGKTIEDNILEVTRYQAALIKAAAKGDEFKGEHDFLDEEDLNGATYAEYAAKELQNAQSEYRLDKMNIGYTRKDGKTIPETVPAADATEGGIIFADVINDKGEKGRLRIDFNNEEQIVKEKPDPWWKFW